MHWKITGCRLPQRGYVMSGAVAFFSQCIFYREQKVKGSTSRGKNPLSLKGTQVTYLTNQQRGRRCPLPPKNQLHRVNLVLLHGSE